MAKNKTIKVILPIFALGLLMAVGAKAATLNERLAGRIILQVEDKGQAWYIEPSSLKRLFLGRPADAFAIMRKFGLGISEADYGKWRGKAPAKLGGKILIRAAAHGEAYYVNPADLKLYSLGRPADAFLIMRKLGLGIRNADLKLVPVLIGYEDGKPSVPEDANNGGTDTGNGNTGEGNVPEIMISDMRADHLSTSTAIVSWSMNSEDKAVLRYWLKGSSDKKEQEASGKMDDSGKYYFIANLSGLAENSEYLYSVDVIRGGRSVLNSGENSFATLRGFRSLKLGDAYRLVNTTVESSFPAVAGKAGSLALSWWDGYAAYSLFNPAAIQLQKTINYSGSSYGDIAFNGTAHALAWQKSCRIYANVIDSLNKDLVESKSVASRLGESCPTNIRLGSDGSNFGLAWTATDMNGSNNLYFKVFNSKGASLNPEQIATGRVDMSVRPALAWNGERYLLFWQEDGSLYSAAFDKDGAMAGEKARISASAPASGNIEALGDASSTELFWAYNEGGVSKIRALGLDAGMNAAKDKILDLDMEIDAASLISAARGVSGYALSWQTGKKIYAIRLDSDLAIDSLAKIVSNSGTPSLQGELFADGDKYGILWQENADMGKNIYYRSIE